MRRIVRGGWWLGVVLLLIGVLGCNSSDTATDITGNPTIPGGTQTGGTGGNTGGDPVDPGNNTNPGGDPSGGTTQRGGEATFHLNWDNGGTSTAARSMLVEVLSNGKVVAQQVIDRVGSEDAVDVHFHSLPEGLLYYIATTFSKLEAAGDKLTEACGDLRVLLDSLVSINLVQSRDIMLLDLRPVSADLAVGQTVKYAATAISFNGESVLIPVNQVAWATGNAGIATINSSGELRGVHAGETTVSATVRIGDNVIMKTITSVTVH